MSRKAEVGNFFLYMISIPVIVFFVWTSILAMQRMFDHPEENQMAAWVHVMGLVYGLFI